MGSSHYVFVGPYFRCINPIVAKDVPVHGTCPTKECSNYRKQIHSQFCGKCGQKGTTLTKTENGPAVNTNDVRMALSSEDALSDLENGSGPIIKSAFVDLWCGNAWPKGYRPTRRFNQSTEETCETEIGQEIIEQEKRLLSEAFSSDLKVLQKMYGNDNVRVCWGIISYDY